MRESRAALAGCLLVVALEQPLLQSVTDELGARRKAELLQGREADAVAAYVAAATKG